MLGADVVRYDDFPADGDVIRIDTDTGPGPVAEGTADVVAAVEAIEHAENPWAFARGPAHLTALLDVDLRWTAAECGWTDVTIRYTGPGRVPGSGRHVPRWLSAFFPRTFSDNLALIALTPTAASNTHR